MCRHCCGRGPTGARSMCLPSIRRVVPAARPDGRRMGAGRGLPPHYSAACHQGEPAVNRLLALLRDREYPYAPVEE